MAVQFRISENKVFEPHKEIKVAGEREVVVIGGGSAGVVAAVAAARNGAATLLIERFGSLGGTFSGGLMNHAESRHVFYDRIPHQELVIRGLYEEVVERCRKLEGIIEEYELKQKVLPFLAGVEVFSPEVLKSVLFDMAVESGVELLLHSYAVEAAIKGNELAGIFIENKSGRQAILGKVFIDCTGDADVASFAGAPFEKGRKEDGKLQPGTLTFRLGNINIAEFMKAFAIPGRTIEVGMKADQFARKHPFSEPIRKARENGDFSIPREDITFHLTPLEGVLYVNATRVHDVDGTDAGSLSRAEVEGRKQVMELAAFFRKYIQGCEKAFLLDTGNCIGIRETRRIVGEYVITGEDVLAGKKFEDAIARSAQRVDEHSPDGSATVLKTLPPGDTFQIPYRCLVPKKVERLLVAGRCISANRHGQAALRMVPICMAMGQAAGTAAALCINTGATPRNLEVPLLQKTLLYQGVVI